jgi:hypothetical protein
VSGASANVDYSKFAANFNRVFASSPWRGPPPEDDIFIIQTNKSNGDPRALRKDEGLAGEIRSFLSCFESRLHMLGHPPKFFFVAFHRLPLQVSYACKNRSGDCEKERECGEQEIAAGFERFEKRALLLFFAAIAWFPIVWVGIKLIDRNRGLALLVWLFDLFLLGGSLLLSVDTLFPWNLGL